MAMWFRNSDDAWGSVARGFHWLIAALVIAQFLIGNVAEEMKLTPAKLDLFVWHKSIGVTVLVLAVLRLAWRFGNPPPAPPAGTPAWERRLGALVHWVLYALIFIVPLSGWWVSDASRVPFRAYFLVPMPDLIATDRGLQEAAAEVHEALTIILLCVAIVHIAAALRHHFLLHDDVLRRMLTGRSSKE
ncbi:MAG: cytochrome b [Gammaproteobacteria bacterium]|nr:cytochrome b [Gammaproteobacteria bacterium]MDH3552422.1 cytochrome b [Gammaproteobacteria bacterium]